MPEKTNFQATEKHQTSMADVVDQASTIIVFGKVIKDLQPTSQGDRFAQIFGYKRNGVCGKLSAPVVIALPEPDGAADDCGWSRDEFVRWQLPASFASIQLHIQPVALGRALTAFRASSLDGAQLFAIISSSIQAVTGATPSLTPSATLQSLGIITPQQLFQLGTVLASKVSENDFNLDNNALAAMNSNSTIAQLQTAIFGGAKPNA